MGRRSAARGARRVAGAFGATFLVTALTMLPAPSATAGPGTDCEFNLASLDRVREVPWAQNRLDYRRVHQLATGAGTTVAVIDSGLGYSGPGANPDALSSVNPQVDAIATVEPTNVLQAYGYDPRDVKDCEGDGHGTAVAALIAARPMDDVGFVGLAPDAEIMPIKQTDSGTEDAGNATTLAAAIYAAIAQRVDVINMSLSVPADPELAVRDAVIAAGQADIVVVAAPGNLTDEDVAHHYPAEYAQTGPEFAHLISVGATNVDDSIQESSVQAGFVGVSAPGGDMLMPAVGTGYWTDSGTSFATPLVSATAALLKERFGDDMSAAEIVNRIKATADPASVSVPNDAFGYGILNPYVALTAERDDTLVAPAPAPQPAANPPIRPEPPDRTLQNIAYAVAAGLLGGALLFAVGSSAWRRTLAERRAMMKARAQS